MTITPEAIDAAFAAEAEYARNRVPDGRGHSMPPRDQAERMLAAAGPHIIRSAAAEQFEQAIREVTDQALEPMRAAALKSVEEAVDSRLATARTLGAMAERDRLRLDLPPQVVTLHGHQGEPVAAVLRCGLLYLSGDAR